MGTLLEWKKTYGKVCGEERVLIQNTAQPAYSNPQHVIIGQSDRCPLHLLAGWFGKEAYSRFIIIGMPSVASNMFLVCLSKPFMFSHFHREREGERERVFGLSYSWIKILGRNLFLQSVLAKKKKKV